MNKPRFGSIKSAIGKNNKLTAGISFSFLFLIMFALFAFIITGLYHFGLIDLPAFIQNLFFKTDGGGPEAEKDDKNIYDFLAQNSGPENHGSAGGESFVAEITLENVREAIANLKLPDDLRLDMEAFYYTDGEISRTEEMTLWKKGGKYRYMLSVNSLPEELYINDLRHEQIENFTTGEILKRKAPTAFSFGDVPHMPDINHYLDLLGGEITEYTLRQTDESNILQIEYALPQINRRELISISLDTGIVLEVFVFGYDARDDKHYQCTTKADAVTPVQDSLFEIK